jgi:hypothetical protein
MKKTFLALLLAALCLLGCFAQAATMSEMTETVLRHKVEETGVEPLLRQFLDGLWADDLQRAADAMTPGVIDESDLTAFTQLRSLLPVNAPYALTPVKYAQQLQDGATLDVFLFRLTAANRDFRVQTVQAAGMPGLYYINIAPWTENADIAPVQAAVETPLVLQILFLVLSAASFALPVWALIDCMCHKFRRRWLWVLLCIFGSVVLSVASTGSHFSLHFNFGLYLMASSITLTSGGFALQLVLPVGPIVYLCCRKKLHPAPAKGFAEAFPEAAAGEAAPEESRPAE